MAIRRRQLYDRTAFAHGQSRGMPMIVEQFWDLIDRSRELAKGALQEQQRHLQALLEELPAREILAFDKIFLGYAKLSYRATLWAALYIKEGGCSDDAFDYCRYE